MRRNLGFVVALTLAAIGLSACDGRQGKLPATAQEVAIEPPTPPACPTQALSDKIEAVNFADRNEMVAFLATSSEVTCLGQVNFLATSIDCNSLYSSSEEAVAAVTDRFLKMEFDETKDLPVFVRSIPPQPRNFVILTIAESGKVKTVDGIQALAREIDADIFYDYAEDAAVAVAKVFVRAPFKDTDLPGFVQGVSPAFRNATILTIAESGKVLNYQGLWALANEIDSSDFYSGDMEAAAAVTKAALSVTLTDAELVDFVDAIPDSLVNASIITLANEGKIAKWGTALLLNESVNYDALSGDAIEARASLERARASLSNERQQE